MPFLLVFLLLCSLATPLASASPCRIEVVDQENGWPVPLVELTTTHNVTFISDNAGLVAVDLPELMEREVWFTIRSDGYELPADGFGYRGLRLTLSSGTSHQIKIKRTMLAKRLGRLTGGGIFSESQKLGEHLDWKESGVFGCDSIQMATHRGKRFWAWGDTNLPRYPLGIFNMTGAATPQLPLTSFEPPVKLQLDYFKDDQGNPREIARIPGDGPTWINGCVSLPDQSGTPHLVGTYSKIRGFLQAYQIGLCAWDETTAHFVPFHILWEESPGHGTPPPAPHGHPAFWTDADDRPWLLFGDPFPTLRMPPTFEAWQDPQQWQNLTPQSQVESARDGNPIKPHRGSIAWNDYRKKWIAVFTQMDGSPSPLGEIWYAEAEQPTGPWGQAIKILTHENYTFYNPLLHQDFTPEGSPVLLFEGTYTSTFSKYSNKTPRYDYNQILYRLDLDDPAFVDALTP